MSSARSRPTPSTGSAAARSTCEGSERLTSSLVAVTGGAGGAAAGAAPPARGASPAAMPATTVPLAPSTVTGSPSRSTVVAVPEPTTAGMPSSRATIAAWQVMPPESVTIAAARRIIGTQSGAVMRATSTSPSARSAAVREETMRTGPLAEPGAAPSPWRSTSPAGGPWCRVVIGRACSIQSAPPSSKAHSVSCGSP